MVLLHIIVYRETVYDVNMTRPIATHAATNRADRPRRSLAGVGHILPAAGDVTTGDDNKRQYALHLSALKSPIL